MNEPIINRSEKLIQTIRQRSDYKKNTTASVQNSEQTIAYYDNGLDFYSFKVNGTDVTIAHGELYTVEVRSVVQNLDRSVRDLVEEVLDTASKALSRKTAVIDGKEYLLVELNEDRKQEN